MKKLIMAFLFLLLILALLILTKNSKFNAYIMGQGAAGLPTPSITGQPTTSPTK